MKKRTVCDYWIVIVLVATVLFFSLSYIFTPQKSFSEDENRMLQGMPRFTLAKLLDGSFSKQLHDYFSDQISHRSILVEMKAFLSLALGKNQNNGVLLGSGARLIEIGSYSEENYRYLTDNLQKIEILMAKLEENGVLAESIILPRKIDVLLDNYSSIYSGERERNALRFVSERHYVAKDELIDAQKHSEVFYKTDHHLNSFGIYRIYLLLSETLGFAPLSLEEFELYTATYSFLGTSYSKSGFFFIPADKISTPSLPLGRYRTTIVDTRRTLDSPYDTSYLDKKDKYSLFLSGNNAHVRVRDTFEEKESILLVKDSYAHALTPFLCQHYDIELIDPRYFTDSIEEYILDSKVEKVVFLFGLDTLASAKLSIK